MDLIYFLLTLSVVLMIIANIRVVCCSKTYKTRILFLFSFFSSITALCLSSSSEFSVFMKLTLGLSSVMVLFNYTSFRTYNYVMSRRLKTPVKSIKMRKYREYVLRSVVYYFFMVLVFFKYYCLKNFDMEGYLIGMVGMQKLVFISVASVIILLFVLLHIFKNRFFEKGSKFEKKLLSVHNVFQLLLYIGGFVYAYNSTPDDSLKDITELFIVLFFTMLTCLVSTIFLGRYITPDRDKTGNKLSLYVDVVNFMTLIPSLLYLILFF